MSFTFAIHRAHMPTIKWERKPVGEPTSAVRGLRDRRSDGSRVRENYARMRQGKRDLRASGLTLRLAVLFPGRNGELPWIFFFLAGPILWQLFARAVRAYM